MKRKLNINFLRLHVFEILVLACIILTTSISLAAYTNQSYKKGVATTNGSKACFSSNYLKQYDNGTASFDDDTYLLTFLKQENAPATVTEELTISNHAPDDATLYNTKDITYTLKFTLEALNNTSITYTNYLIDNTSFSADGTLQLDNQQLIGGRSSINKYNITIPYADIGNVCITVTATPTEPANVNNKMLARKLYTTLYTQGTTDAFNWKGALSDKTESNSPEAYHAYNFEISGTAGSGTVTLTWDTRFVEIDPFFAAGTVSETDSNRKTYTFSVNATGKDAVNYYLIQFYRTSANVATSWDAVYGGTSAYITFSATKTTA